MAKSGGQSRIGKKYPPAKSPEAREQQLISLAIDNIEEQLRNGTASSQLLSQLLRMASTRDKLERERLIQQTELLKTQRAAIEAQETAEALYEEAMDAMRTYGGGRDVI